jgi:predicted alpha/beta-hydrolase family hydrolase
MSAPDFLFDGPDSPGREITLVLAHGAGAPMDSPFMNAMARGLAGRGIRVARFEFPYMRSRREAGKSRPPDREPVLLQAWRDAVEAVGGNVVIGGKSMGGRMASLVADEIGARGLVCLGYPFHPPGKPETLRVKHLEHLKTPALIVQGTRDALGSREDVQGYALSPAIRLVWLEDGDHSFKPRVASGHTEKGHLAAAVEAVAGFVEERSLP